MQSAMQTFDGRDPKPVFTAWCALTYPQRTNLIVALCPPQAHNATDERDATQQWRQTGLENMQQEVAQYILRQEWLVGERREPLSDWVRSQSQSHAINESPVPEQPGRWLEFVNRRDELKRFTQPPFISPTMLVQGPCTFGKSTLLREVTRRRSGHPEKTKRLPIDASQFASAEQIISKIIQQLGDIELIRELRDKSPRSCGTRLATWFTERFVTDPEVSFIVGIDDTDRMPPEEQSLLLEYLVTPVNDSIPQRFKGRILICVSGRHLGTAWRTAKSRLLNDSSSFKFQTPHPNTLGAITPGSLYDDLSELNGKDHDDKELITLATRAFYITGGNPSALSNVLHDPGFGEGVALENRLPLSNELQGKLIGSLRKLVDSTPDHLRETMRVLCLMPRWAKSLLREVSADSSLNPKKLRYEILEEQLKHLGYIPSEQSDREMLYTAVGSSFFAWHRLSGHSMLPYYEKAATMYDNLLRSREVHGEFAADLIVDRMLQYTWMSYSESHASAGIEPNVTQRGTLRRTVIDRFVPGILEDYMSGRSIGAKHGFTESALTHTLGNFRRLGSDKTSTFRLMVDYFLNDESQAISPTAEIVLAVEHTVGKWLKG